MRFTHSFLGLLFAFAPLGALAQNAALAPDELAACKQLANLSPADFNAALAKLQAQANELKNDPTQNQAEVKQMIKKLEQVAALPDGLAQKVVDERCAGQVPKVGGEGVSRRQLPNVSDVGSVVGGLTGSGKEGGKGGLLGGIIIQGII
ncbi:hypothetical protein AJ79_04628 [Helicocarpus griseus UAMH5409]|uniref:Cell wall protein n=1 Tax=Helicocarpus griseus UAMH5409 TaxID=1447875 RepID=A0A2B7XST7_9EURO|nr:hypothetical protein AJ79_04628 [Helicocarpus griseus UAMH5409]